jgi:hypothetical protein
LLIALDQLTGPHVRVSVGFVLPVALAAYRWGWAPAIGLGLALGFSRVWLVAGSQMPWLVLPELVNLGLSLMVFLAVAAAARHLGRSRAGLPRQRPTLPVCGGCGRVKNAAGRWERFERLVSTVDSADFRHTVCPECERRVSGAHLPRSGPPRRGA